MLRCARFHLTTITFRTERGVGGFFFHHQLDFFFVLIFLQSKHLCLLRAEGAMLKQACTNASAAQTGLQHYMRTPIPVHRRFSWQVLQT